jgi:multidrug resistance efflux pump
MTWRKPLTAAVIVLGVGLSLGFYWPFGKGPTPLSLPGTVEIQEVRLGSKIGGRVAEVCVREGDLVKAGRLLVRFDAPELEARRQQLAAAVQSAEADFEKARAGPRPEEKTAAREAVEAARAHWQLLKAGSRAEEIEQARQEFESAEADRKLARLKHERVRRLVPQVAVSAEEYDAATATLRRTEAQAGAAQARLSLLRAGSRAEEIAEAAAKLKQAQANYDLLLAGSRSEDILAAEARLSEARGKLQEVEANLQEAQVKAAEPEVVEVLAVRKGDLVQPNQIVVRVLRADDLWVKAYVPEPQLGQVRLGQEVQVQIDSYPGRRFIGTVAQVASESEFTPRNVQSADERRHQVFGIKVRVDNPEGIFKSGMAAQVYIPMEK